MRKADLQTAVEEGYRIYLIQDGIGTVTNHEDVQYHVDIISGTCDCPDALINNGGSYSHDGHQVCTHQAYVAQTTICQHCRGYMTYTVCDTTEGSVQLFECLKCNNAIDAGLLEERRDERRKATTVETAVA